MSFNDLVDDEVAGRFTLPSLYNLVYCSRAASGVDQAAVASIIEIAQRRNAVNGITGLLVFGSGIFFQWLEGPRGHVTHLMAKIKADGRHDTIITLSENEEVRERLFPNWAMELVTAEDIRSVLEDALDDTDDENSIMALKQLMQQLDDSDIGSGERT